MTNLSHPVQFPKDDGQDPETCFYIELRKIEGDKNHLYKCRDDYGGLYFEKDQAACDEVFQSEKPDHTKMPDGIYVLGMYVADAYKVSSPDDNGEVIHGHETSGDLLVGSRKFLVSTKKEFKWL